MLKSTTSIAKTDEIMKENGMESYYYLCLDHKEILTAFYGYYMEFTPSTVKKIFKLMFLLNKIFRLLLTYCLFYHTIWWLPNSTSKNLAINYSNIDPFIFFILIYYNFYKLLINDLLFRLIFMPLLKFVVPDRMSMNYLLNLSEIFIHISMNCCVFYYLQYYFEPKYVVLIMLPHIFFLMYNMFDISITLYNCEVFSNRSGNIIIKI